MDDSHPAKKRRFFADLSEPSSPAPLSSSPPAPKRRFFQPAPDEHVLPLLASPLGAAASSNQHPPRSAPRSPLDPRDVDRSSIQAPSSARPGPGAEPEGPVPFDEAAFESFVGDTVSPDVMSIIRDHCGGVLDRAVNMYFDGTWKKWKNKSGLQKNKPHGNKPLPKAQESAQSLPTPTALDATPEARYIGAFGAEGWATRSSNHLIKHGDVVRIERQKIQSTSNNSRRPPRIDVVVRFTTLSGAELGRLTRDTANWVSSLIDQKVCRFEATCVYAPERLRTNDTVFLQLRCSLLKTAFDGRGLRLADNNRKTGIFEQAETSQERDLRLRQVALVRLFQEINLLPTRGNAQAASAHRQGLLDAAELAEKKEEKVESPSAQILPRTSSNDGGTASPAPEENEPEDGQELEQDQLDALYKKAQSFDFNTSEAEPADTFEFTLRPYQKQALHWMMSKEKDEKRENREEVMHPLWEEYTWPTKDFDDEELPHVPRQTKFYVNPYSGDLSLDFPAQEQHCLGGILADEMGLGKTIQMLALVHSNRSQRAIQARDESASRMPRLLPSVSGQAGVVDAPCTTLVVAPMSLLAQWQSEAERASKEGTLKSMVYYGSDKAIDLTTLCCEANAANAPDVIITSYGVVVSEFNQVAKSISGHGNVNSANARSALRGVFSLNFYRVILDEGHSIKNRQSKTARACYEITAEHRWVLTGTPIVNRLEDLFSLVRFLRVEPWNNFSFWRTFITVPFESGNFVRALDVVQTVLEPLVMRRTKDMKTPDGQLLVPLPPKHVEIVDIELPETERAVYDYIFTAAKRTFQANVEAGTVLKAFTSIFAQILRLRQSCCHPTLVRNQNIVAEEEESAAAADIAAGLGDDMDLQSLIERFTAQTTADEKDDNQKFGAHAFRQIRDEATSECPVCCEEPMVDQTVTGCWHSACKQCLLDYIKHQADKHELPRCFSCRAPINRRDLFEVVRHDDDSEGSSSGPSTPSTPSGAHQPGAKRLRISLQRLESNHSSAKVVALLSHLRALRREHPTMKSVVFSQFTSFLTLLEPVLVRAGIHFVRLDGTMAQKARAATLDEFRRQDNRFVVLLLSLRAGGVGLNLTTAKRVFMLDPWWSFAVEAQAIDRVHRMGQDEEVHVYRFIVKGSVEERMLRIQDRKKFLATSLGMMSGEEKKMARIEDIRELLS